MDILISYEKAEAAASIAPGGVIKAYAVPVAYSSDKLYIAGWGAGELEPVPACNNSQLLLHLRLSDDGQIVECFKQKGVDYA